MDFFLPNEKLTRTKSTAALRVLRQRMATVVEGGYSVELGDGCYDAFLNDEIGWVARRLYYCANSYSPRTIKERACTSHGGSPSPTETPSGRVAEGDATDERLLTATIVDVSFNLVHFASKMNGMSPSVGFAKETFVFEDKATADRAIQLDRSRAFSSTDVMRCLSRSLDAHTLKDILCEGERHVVQTDKLESLDEDLIRLPTGAGTSLFRDPSVKRVLKTWVYLRDRRVAAHATIISWHWAFVSKGVMRHMGDRRILIRWVPMALAGGVVELTMQADEGGPDVEWPWWIDRATRIVDDVPVEEQYIQCKRQRTVPESVPSPPPLSLSAPDVSKSQQRALTRWDRSSRARGVDRIRLLKSLRIPDTGEWNLPGRRRAVRKQEDDHAEVKRIFEENFGHAFATQAVQAAALDERICVFHIIDGDGASLGAVSMIVFECTLPSGDEGLAVLIDTFAVETKQHGRGIGGVMFHDFCRPFAERHHRGPPPSSYLMFAQCVRKGGAGNFWLDKLDSTSQGRSVMLQAYQLSHVGVQAESQCDVRSRIYHPTVRR